MRTRLPLRARREAAMNQQPLIVLLEDEPPQLTVLEAALRASGEVVSFSEPVAALEFLNDHPADVALIDINLGTHAKMDGLEFIRAVREFDCDLCIIIRTGNDTAELADHAIALGAFRRSIKTKQSVQELRQLTKQAIEETGHRRKISRDAASSAMMRNELGEALVTLDEDRSVGDNYRTFLHGMRNRLTAVAGMAELLYRETNTAPAREHAARNRQLVATLVSDLGQFLDAPLTRLYCGADRTGTSVNAVIETLHRKFALSATGVEDGKILNVRGLSEDLLVAAPPLRFIAALRHIIEFSWQRIAPGGSILLSTWCCESVQQEVDSIHAHKLLFSRRPSALPKLTVAFRISCELLNTTESEIRRGLEEYGANPRHGCLHTVAQFADAFRSVLLVYQGSHGATHFELYIAVEAG